MLRDFWLAKEHNGKAISSAEYMELQLSDKQAAAWRRADSKEAREKLVRFFRLRDCVPQCDRSVKIETKVTNMIFKIKDFSVQNQMILAHKFEK